DFSTVFPQGARYPAVGVEVRWRSKCLRSKKPCLGTRRGRSSRAPGGEGVFLPSTFLLCRLCRLLLPFERLLPALAVDAHFEDDAVMDETVDGGERHGLVGEDVVPFAERLVGGDRQRPALVAHRDQLEQNASLRLVLGDVGDVV